MSTSSHFERTLWNSTRVVLPFAAIIALSGCSGSKYYFIPDELYASQQARYLAAPDHKSFWLIELGAIAGSRSTREKQSGDDRGMSYFFVESGMSSKQTAIAVGRDSCQRFAQRVSRTEGLRISLECILIAADDETHFDISPKLYSRVKPRIDAESQENMESGAATLAAINRTASIVASARAQQDPPAPTQPSPQRSASPTLPAAPPNSASRSGGTASNTQPGAPATAPTKPPTSQRTEAPRPVAQARPAVRITHQDVYEQDASFEGNATRGGPSITYRVNVRNVGDGRIRCETDLQVTTWNVGNETNNSIGLQSTHHQSFSFFLDPGQLGSGGFVRAVAIRDGTYTVRCRDAPQ